MQFILTLLISVRGRKLLKDGSALSFTGRAGWFDRLARKVREARPGQAQGPWTGVFLVSVKDWARGERGKTWNPVSSTGLPALATPVCVDCPPQHPHLMLFSISSLRVLLTVFEPTLATLEKSHSLSRSWTSRIKGPAVLGTLRCPSSCFVLTDCFPAESQPRVSTSCEDTGLVGQGAMLVNSFQLNYFLRVSVSMHRGLLRYG